MKSRRAFLSHNFKSIIEIEFIGSVLSTGRNIYQLTYARSQRFDRWTKCPSVRIISSFWTENQSTKNSVSNVSDLSCLWNSVFSKRKSFNFIHRKNLPSGLNCLTVRNTIFYSMIRSCLMLSIFFKPYNLSINRGGIGGGGVISPIVGYTGRLRGKEVPFLITENTKR